MAHRFALGSDTADTVPSFQHIVSAFRLFQGADSLAQLGREIDRLKVSRVVIFCGASLAHDEVLQARVRDALGDRYAGTFSGVRAHSPLPSVLEAARELQRLQAGAVLAVGGGSAIVTARAASIVLAEQRDVRELCTVPDGKGGLHSPRLMAPKLPQFTVPTTPSTASMKSGSAVFDPDTGERLALFDPKTRAQAVFSDPQMLRSAPRALVASAGLNTLVTTVEGLISHIGNPIADGLLMHALRLLATQLPELELRDDAVVRSELLLATVMCAQGTDHTGSGLTTVLGHAIGAAHGIENGIANAILLPYALRFNADRVPQGLAKLGVALGLPDAPSQVLLEAVLQRFAALFGALGVPVRLRDAGIPAASLPQIAQRAMEDWFLRSNPRPVRDASELLHILEQAW